MLKNKYKLRQEAKRDLLKIWRYTAKEWGELQADSYLLALKQQLLNLHENPMAGKARENIAHELRSFPKGEHIIFYIKTAEFLDVVRILHQSMDIQHHFE